MPEFKTFSLGDTLMLAEGIKSAKRQEENDKLRNAYLGEQTATMQHNRNRDTASDAAAAKLAEAKRVYHVSDAVLRSDNLKESVQNIAPDFVKDFETMQGPGSFASLPDDQLKQIFGRMREQSMIAASIQPKFSAPVAGQQNGKDVFFQTDDAGDPRVLPGIAPRPQKKGTGLSVTTPDGTVVQMGEDGVPNYGGVGLTKPNQTKMQEAFINAQGNAYALREQMAKYNPEYSTMGGRAKAGIANVKEQIGMDNAPQQTQFLNDFTSWKADTASLLSQYLNQLSGAAISPHEETRLKAGFPNAEDGPTQYKAKVEATMRRFALVQARAAYLLSNPAQSLDSVSLDSMSNIVSQEATRLAESYVRNGMNEAQARERAIAETQTRFGMGQ